MIGVILPITSLLLIKLNKYFYMINIELEKEILNYVKKLKNGIKWNKLPEKYEKYLKQRYNDNSSKDLKLYLKESYLRIINNIDIIPKCPICNNPLKFDGRSYIIYSSTCGCKKCSNELRKINSRKTKLEKYGDENYSNKEKQKQTKLERYGDPNYNNIEKQKQTCLEKYGVSSYTKTDECKNKIKKTCIERYGVINGGCSKEALEKIKEIFLSKYGVESSWKIPGVIDKSKKTKLEKYGNENFTNREKAKQTCLEKYGVDNVFKTKEAQEKYKNTCLSNWGVDHNWKIPSEHYLTYTLEALEKKKITSLKNWGTEHPHQCKEIIDKVNNTKRKNNSFNISKSENESYKLLKEKYPNVITQYKSKEYPFVCDFYIPSLDLYIECNYHWTHGGHPYNSNCYNDVLLVENWKQKKTKYYNNAINTWTIRDVNKRNIAKENKLNYIEFWNINELKKWITN